MENAITDDNVDGAQAKLIVEMANSPITASARDELVERGVEIAPDVLANAGGVIVSYFEWQQNRAHENWEENIVQQKLDSTILFATPP